MHDRALQLLSSARLRSETCRRQLLDDRPRLEIELQHIEESIDKAITEIRNLLAETESGDEVLPGSLERRLKEELKIFRARTGFKLDFRCTIGARNLPSIIERELYFALREGVLNAVRYSRASELHLMLGQSKKGYEAHLSDNGIGFDIVRCRRGESLRPQRHARAYPQSGRRVHPQIRTGQRHADRHLHTIRIDQRIEILKHHGGSNLRLTFSSPFR